jgi:hypothetical protein
MQATSAGVSNVAAETGLRVTNLRCCCLCKPSKQPHATTPVQAGSLHSTSYETRKMVRAAHYPPVVAVPMAGTLLPAPFPPFTCRCLRQGQNLTCGSKVKGWQNDVIFIIRPPTDATRSVPRRQSNSGMVISSLRSLQSQGGPCHAAKLTLTVTISLVVKATRGHGLGAVGSET